MLAKSRTESEISRTKCEITSITKMQRLADRVHAPRARAAAKLARYLTRPLAADSLDVVG